MTSNSADTPLSKLLQSPFQVAPMLRLAVALIVGLVLQYLMPVPVYFSAVLLAMSVSTMWWLYSRRGQHWGFYASLWVVYISLGMMLGVLHRPADPFAAHPPQPHARYQVGCTVASVSQSPRSFKVQADITNISSLPARGKVMLYLAQDAAAAALRPGDAILVTITPHSTLDADMPGNYGRTLYRRGVLWQSYVPADQWRIDTSGSLCPTLAMRCRAAAYARQQQLVQRIQHSMLSPAQRGIAQAMLLGWRSDLDAHTRQQFSASGIAHLLCVSGLHVGIVSMLVGWAIFFLGHRRWQRVVRALVQIAAIWYYVFLTGMAPATLRAGVMLSLILLGTILSQQTHSLNNLATSVVLMLLVRPSLLWEVGFQLSVSAVLGIILFYQPLRQIWASLITQSGRHLWLLLPAKLWGWLSLSVAAQLGSLPLTLYYFHQFPTYFLLANLLVVPFAGLLIATMLLVVVASGWSWPAVCLQWELRWVDSLTTWVSSLPGALPSGFYFDGVMAAILALAILCIAAALRLNPKSNQSFVVN